MCVRLTVLASLLVLLLPAGALAATITVEQDGSGDFTTIAAAVGAAASGDSILVGPGVYFEGFATNLVLHVISTDGAAATILDGQDSYRLARWWGGGGLLAGFTLRDG